ncbi:beta-lactamase family protein [Actinomadura sp. ATCC 31491]|uniref:Beta-lactamase family protein n=1 Tax=Actinomadura luzonensis TaxID=2805427 RepID=A0ABT0GBE2_9ACTN|nr:serine hydrolase domain-containing protein [Actinomadura luzonensis]MCK2221936.1 beta-lactamase family protein [Actinomadura luzonensis]
MNRATAAGLAGLACATLTLSTLPAAAASAMSRPRPGDVQQALEELAKTPEVVGAIGEVYVDGERVGKGSAGTRLLNGKGGRIPTGARFRVGSQTKQMTGVVVLQLVKEGKLKLDDKLSDLLPEVAEKDLVERASEITLQQLLQHTSGIPNFLQDKVVDTFDFTTYYPPIELVKKTRTLPRTQEPGARYSYSNTNYMLLGLIIERYTKHTLAAEFERRVFDPLGMNDSYLPTTFPGGIKGPHGHGYFPDSTGQLRDVDRHNMSYGYAAGGVISTAHDISAFQRAFAQNRLLPEDLKKVLMGPPAITPQPGQPSGQPPEGGGGQQQPALLCGGQPAIMSVKGSGPGFNAVTFVSRDGRTRFALSATLAVPNTDQALDPLLVKAAEAVLCPKD